MYYIYGSSWTVQEVTNISEFKHHHYTTGLHSSNNNLIKVYAIASVFFL